LLLGNEPLRPGDALPCREPFGVCQSESSLPRPSVQHLEKVGHSNHPNVDWPRKYVQWYGIPAGLCDSRRESDKIFTTSKHPSLDGQRRWVERAQHFTALRFLNEGSTGSVTAVSHSRASFSSLRCSMAAAVAFASRLGRIDLRYSAGKRGRWPVRFRRSHVGQITRMAHRFLCILPCESRTYRKLRISDAPSTASNRGAMAW